ncbi:pyridoxamine 5'-phosphate oxidase family protein [Yinghuangia soli]|uniref:Pyridoxamine 5'-phosphate oxidase family protein n=1 Tax=Yinghuangia soli TaxID=2908204 RepID=A0AA41U7Y4_9ACTN|nr:pyridoxamine 5'-phosphate oxidase family protein [Yinghuangia soli]MCF2532379.1 pyridoxamine 5'-phosphate oxidase family protein [Yinghuangia soli]
MARWDDVVKAEPAFADEVAKAFDAFTHKTIATLRADGSPRISGTESRFIGGELWFGSMPGAVKARDLLRDPRFAVHGGTGTEAGPEWRGDAKLAGRAVEVTDEAVKKAVFGAWGPEEAGKDGAGENGTGAGSDGSSDGGSEGGSEGAEDPERPSHLFRGEVDEVVMTTLNEARDGLVIRVWTADRGLRIIERQ